MSNKQQSNNEERQEVQNISDKKMLPEIVDEEKTIADFLLKNTQTLKPNL
jgi:hypothetical protein